MPYASLSSFDDLPTPFRAIAVDLVTAQQVILDKGTLASAMRATMSLPGIFPPVERDGRVLVDGGAMNNVPADVVRAMGADVVIAVNVGLMGDTRTVSRSLVGLIGQTVDVMMLARTRASLRAADIVINPPLVGFASLDWRRSAELAADGYRAADAMKDTLLPFAVDEAQWAAYQGVDRRGERPRCRSRSSCRWLVRCLRIRPASRSSSPRASDSPSTSTPSRRISRVLPDSIGTKRWDGSSTRWKAGQDSVWKPGRRPMLRRFSCWASASEHDVR